ncbi:unnamed protein product [Sphagnum troendelagicum]|uniref:BZIP domain-containing protein n=1 Tax=Sphagnum troendelagicum TaxID=128251 RepID=A0ABP0V0S3_9BRYO
MGSSSIAAADTTQAAGNADGMSMLLRQPSLQLLQGAMSLPRTLSRKTVDQVWKDIHRDSSSGGSDSGGGLPLGPTSTSVQERQTTFGEMTLEDFLMKAGVVREDAADIGTSQQQQAFSSFMGSSALHPHGERSDRINVQSGDPGDRISGATAASDSDGMLSPMHYGLDGPFRGRKRGPDGPVEKVVERRQRRMIKNRESAARSRARKQAYTVELEAEVNQLKEENSRLRKQQLMEMMKLASKSMASKANILRRTRTAMW